MFDSLSSSHSSSVAFVVPSFESFLLPSVACQPEPTLHSPTRNHDLRVFGHVDEESSLASSQALLSRLLGYCLALCRLDEVQATCQSKTNYR